MNPPQVVLNQDGDILPNLSRCTRIFQFLLPIALALGTAAIMTGVIIDFIPGAADPGLQAASEITRAVGTSTLGLFGTIQLLWSKTTGQDSVTRQDGKNFASAVNAAAWGCIIFLTMASYFPNIEQFADAVVGLRIGLLVLGTAFSGCAVFVSVKMYQHYSPVPSEQVPIQEIVDEAEENPFTPRELEQEVNTNYEKILASRDCERRDTFFELDPEAGPKPTRRVTIRRLASSTEFVVNATGIVSSIGAALASLLIWYLYLRGRQTKLHPPRRRTTIIKKRPTFVKGKRRATHKPTLSSLRSEGNLVPLS